MGRKERKQLLEAIAQKRGSFVFAYVTSDRPNLGAPIATDVVPLVYEHLHSQAPDTLKKTDLVIYSRGGHADAPWSIVSAIRECTGNGRLGVLIPYRAHSAATLVALGADEIVMTPMAELGPIDATVGSGPYNPQEPTEKDRPQRLPVSVEDVRGYFELLDTVECKEPTGRLSAFKEISQQVHPLALGNVNRILRQTTLVASRLLKTRTEPYPDAKNQEIVDALSSEICSHNHAIHRSEAVNEIGLEHVTHAEDVDINEELWSLYKEYCEYFDMLKPFEPEKHLDLNDLQENVWKGLSIAMVESIDCAHVRKYDKRVRRLRKVPPQVKLSVNNIDFPALPDLPEGIEPEQLIQAMQSVIQSMMPAVLQGAAEQVAQALLKGLPGAGFEHLDYNYRWTRVR